MVCLSYTLRFVHRQCLKIICWLQGWKEKIMCWPRRYSWNYPRIGRVRVEHIASMSWRRRLCEHSCLPSRHHLSSCECWAYCKHVLKKKIVWTFMFTFKTSSILMKSVGKIQGWSRQSAKSGIKLINTQSIEDVPCGIMWSHGMVSIVHYALCTNPWSMCVVFSCGVRDLSVGLHQKEDFI